MSRDNNVSITAIQAALSAAGFLRAAAAPFSGHWDSVTAAGYAEYARQHNGNERQQAQPTVLGDIIGPLAAAIGTGTDANGDGVVDVSAAPNPVTYNKSVGASGAQDLTTVSNGVVSAVSSTGTLPTGVTLARTGNVIKATGSPSAAQTGSFSLNITTDNGNLVVPVNYTIAA